MVFRPSRWAWAGGVAAATCGAGAVWLYVWLIRTLPFEERGTRWLLMAFAPLVIGFCAAGCWYGVQSVWEAGQRFAVSANGVARKDWIGGAAIRWSELKDWALPPSGFPYAPKTLVLVSHGGRRLVLPLHLRPRDELRNALKTHFAALTEHGGLDRARHLAASATPSVWRVRCQRHGGAIVQGYSGLTMTLLFGAAVGMLLIDTVNYLRIRTGPHAVADAEIVAIKDDDDGDRVRVRYRTAAGGEVYLRRPVQTGFSESHDVGDHVAVEYLPHRPTVGNPGVGSGRSAIDHAGARASHPMAFVLRVAECVELVVPAVACRNGVAPAGVVVVDGVVARERGHRTVGRRAP